MPKIAETLRRIIHNISLSITNELTIHGIAHISGYSKLNQLLMTELHLGVSEANRRIAHTEVLVPATTG